MPNCPECENGLDIELDEVDEGDVVACDECGVEYEVVGTDPLELAKVEASRFSETSGAEATEAERERVRAQLKDSWQRRYGLVEAG